MATAGLDRKLQLWDLRTHRALGGLLLPLGASELAFSQRGLLAAACGDLVQVGRGGKSPDFVFFFSFFNAFPPPQVYQPAGGELSPKPYLCHRLSRPPQGLRFCPFEDVLGVGHGAGFSSLLVPGRGCPRVPASPLLGDKATTPPPVSYFPPPGAGEANFDALENNPYRSRKQRQEWEVKALLEKVNKGQEAGGLRGVGTPPGRCSPPSRCPRVPPPPRSPPS